MRYVLVVLVLIFFAGSAAQSACVNFTVAVQDTLGNVDHGLSPKDAKWFQDKIAKKYAGICYAKPSPSVPVVFYITLTPDTYHGTRTVENTSTSSGPVSGTVTDQDGNTSTVQATQQTTTTSDEEVPYDVDYAIYTLAVERRGPDGKFQVLHRFQQRGLYREIYGIPLGGRGHHPEHAVIEDAAKWISAGGLNGSNQSALPSTGGLVP